jgi:1-acyl-sn-glycerol-3-phosphate acyltransferase
MTPDLLSVGCLLLVAAAMVAAVTVSLIRSRYRPMQSVLLFLAVVLTRVLWRARLPRQFPIPPGQGAVLVCNHRSSVDPFFVQSAADRAIHWMVAREYCEHPAFGWFLRTADVIPVNRGGIDTGATKTAIRLAASGGLVGMLPEGRINMSRQLMLPVRPGAVMVALKARVPILPCYIEGAPYGGKAWSPFFMPAKTRLVFGRLMDLSAYYDRHDEEGLAGRLMLQVAGEIARLAGQEDFQPRLAGRRWKPTDEELASAIAGLSRPADPEKGH